MIRTCEPPKTIAEAIFLLVIVAVLMCGIIYGISEAIIQAGKNLEKSKTKPVKEYRFQRGWKTNFEELEIDGVRYSVTVEGEITLKLERRIDE